MPKKFKVAMVSNIPAPYRLDILRQVAEAPDVESRVFYCSSREPNRDWDLGELAYDHVFLKESFLTWRGRFIHTNPDVWSKLKAFSPDVIVTTGFNPTHLAGYLYARWHRLPHVAMTDGTYQSESVGLSLVHRWIRRHVYRRTATFIGACDGTFDLYRHYGIADDKMFKSHLCANNAAFASACDFEKKYDFVFCGRFAQVKNPLFALQVGRAVAQRLGRRVSIAFVGAGDQEEMLRSEAAASHEQVQADFLGFARQAELPMRYGQARVFLFPTSWDPWGVVANEACAAGLPTLISPVAGSAHELIRHGVNGYVLPLDIDAWADAACQVLTDTDLWHKMSERARLAVADYNYTNAAKGILSAVRAAYDGRKKKP